MFNLQNPCCWAIISCTTVHLIDKLPQLVTIKSHLRSSSVANGIHDTQMLSLAGK